MYISHKLFVDEALKDYQSVLELDPKNVVAHKAVRELPAKIEERNEKLKAEMKGKLSKKAQDLVLQCLTHEAHKRPSISEIAEDVSTLEFSDENTIDSKKLKYFFTRQR